MTLQEACKSLSHLQCCLSVLTTLAHFHEVFRSKCQNSNCLNFKQLSVASLPAHMLDIRACSPQCVLGDVWK